MNLSAFLIFNLSVHHLKLFDGAGYPNPKRQTQTHRTIQRRQVVEAVGEIRMVFAQGRASDFHVLFVERLGFLVTTGSIVQGRQVVEAGCAEVFETIVAQVIAFFKTKGIDLSEYPISFNSWYGSEELVSLLTDKGFNQIAIHAKSSYVFEIGGVLKPLNEQKHRIELKPDLWGCRDTPVARCEAESPTFGTLILLLFRQGGQVKAVMMFGRKLRACEILSIWSQHHGIEQFWRALKTVLQIRQMRLRGREGVYATLAIKVIAYLFMLKVARKCHLTLQQLQMEVAKQLHIEDFFSEHFHPNMQAVSP